MASYAAQAAGFVVSNSMGVSPSKGALAAFAVLAALDPGRDGQPERRGPSVTRLRRRHGACHPWGMARTWLSVTVELLGGRGEELWPWPGRIFAVGPSHTFMDLADAINDAFARWDRSHLSVFTLADGRVITDEETGAEMASSIRGPIIAPIDIAAAKVARTVVPGAEFQFMFDLGDAWMHRCVVGEVKVDPLEVLGVCPDVPLPYWGWGSIPDQYGRRWAADDGEGRVPGKPRCPASRSLARQQSCSTGGVTSLTMLCNRWAGLPMALSSGAGSSAWRCRSSTADLARRPGTGCSPRTCWRVCAAIRCQAVWCRRPLEMLSTWRGIPLRPVAISTCAPGRCTTTAPLTR